MWAWLFKDLALGGRWLALVLAVYCFNLAVAPFSGPLFLFLALSLPVVLVMGGLMIEASNETDPLWCSLPLSRADIVRGRYFTALVAILSGLGLSWLVGQVVSRFLLRLPGGPPAYLDLRVYAFFLAALLFAAGLFFPFYFRFGLGKGTTIFMAVFGGAMIGLSALAQTLGYLLGAGGVPTDPAFWRQAAHLVRPSPAGGAGEAGLWILGGFLSLAFAFFLGSISISIKHFRAREF